MPITQLRGSNQIIDGSVTYVKLSSNFLNSTTWTVSSDNSAVIDGLATPTGANQAATKNYVDSLVDTVLKAPDGFTTVVAGTYPTDYKSTGVVSEGDSFYITDITAGTSVGTATVNVGDLLVATTDNPGNIDTNWIIMESNRDAATETVSGVVELATQVETSAGTDTTKVITPATLAGYIADNYVDKDAGDGMTETATGIFNVIAGDASLNVLADSMAVQVGSSNGTSLETTATGLELATTVVGTRTFNGGAFNVSTGANNLTLTTGGTLTLDGASNSVVLSAQPSTGTDLAIASLKYVNDQIDNYAGGLSTNVFNAQPTVTDGSANVTVSNTIIANTERVYLNGARQTSGVGNAYTVSGSTITFAEPLVNGDVVVVDYEF